MLNTSAYLNDLAPLFEQSATGLDLQRPPRRATHLTVTPHPDKAMHGHRHARQGRHTREYTESLMLVPIWIGSATAVLAAMAELVRGV